ALKLAEETLALRKAKLGPDHPDTLLSMNILASSYAALERHGEALRLREETVALQKTKLGPDHPDTLWSLHNLASSHEDRGRHAEALKLTEEAPALLKATLGPDHIGTLQSMNTLAWFLVTGPEEPRRDARRAVDLAKEAVEHAPKQGPFWNTLGVAYYRA